MVAPGPTKVGKKSDYLVVFQVQAVHVALIVKRLRDALLAMRLRAETSTTLRWVGRGCRTLGNL